MAVSHYLISWIQVVGLIAGLYGFFFLSISLFGNKSLSWFSALLPSSAIALSLVLAFTDAPDVSSIVPPVVTGLAIVVTTISIYLGTALGLPNLIIDATSGAGDTSGNTRRILAGQSALVRIVGFATFLLNLLAMVVYIIDTVAIAFGSAQSVSGPNASFLFVHIAAFVLSVIWIPLYLTLPLFATENRILKLGFVLSAFAILTQFIPPVLDLLNIPIR